VWWVNRLVDDILKREWKLDVSIKLIKFSV
jgi:hypothetical protein